MSALKIIEIPNPLLREISEPVARITPDLLDLLDNMLCTMYAAPGVGLAGVQVGELKRIIVIDISGKDEPKSPLFLINPEIIWHSDEKQECEEGCLSVPKEYATVKRYAALKVRYLDRSGTEQILDADDFLAVVLQHEIDHLDGRLFTDYLSPLKRSILFRNLKKRRRNSSETD